MGFLFFKARIFNCDVKRQILSTLLKCFEKVLGQHAVLVMSRMFSAQPGHPMLIPQKETIFLLSIFLFAFYIVLNLMKVVSPLPQVGSLTLWL